MKKILRIVLILIFIIFIIFLVNLTRNYLILKSLFSFNEEINNYYFEEIITSNDSKNKNCIYAQNNNYYIEVYENIIFGLMILIKNIFYKMLKKIK